MRFNFDNGDMGLVYAGIPGGESAWATRTHLRVCSRKAVVKP